MKILISGYYGFDNAGDELILDSITSEIRKNIPDTRVTVLSANPSKTSLFFGVAAISRWSPFAIIKALLRTDLLISGGGGLFQDKTSSLSLYYYICIILLAKLFGKKVFIYAVGINEMKFVNNDILCGVLRTADAITLRNKESVDCICGNLRKMKRMELTNDAVFCNTVTPRKLSSKNPNIAIVLRPNLGKHQSIELFAKLADSVGQRLSAKLIFIPFHKETDYPFSLKVINHMRTSANIVLWNNPRELYEIFSGIDMIISQRLHALILGVLFGIPLIGMFNDSKLTRFLNEIGQKNLTSFSEENIYSVLANINDLWEWREDFQKNALSILPSFRQRALRNTELLKEIIRAA